IYFAGHGTAQGQHFYLLPHDLGYAGERTRLDAAGLQIILEHSISDEELERAVEGIDADKLLMVIDACNSGQALEAEEQRRGPMNSKGLAQLAYEKGMYILTAAQSYQAAQEASQLGHGLLTYALVEEGLKQAAADSDPKDGEVGVREWFDYASTRVPNMQIEKMKQARNLGISLSFTEGDKRVPDVPGVERRVTQTPRVFYRRESEGRPLIVAKR
ncbi:MAG: caspase family protein, partial [Acidobacteriota bacterium]|nr:caspase family protein [Acidobacteriota bacterium]